MTEKETHERLDYIEHRLARRLAKFSLVTERVDFLMQIFGRRSVEEYSRLCMIYPELLHK